jgi:release factor glutamine methyltransferase
MTSTAAREYIIQSLQSVYEPGESLAIADSLLAHMAQPINRHQLEQYVEQLQQAEPLQYVIGEAWFYGLAFKVNPNVLIPRPETEELVHLIINDLRKEHILSPAILDIGTGSGCIAVSLKKNIPASIVRAIDVSKDALTIALENARIHDAHVEYQCVDILKSDSPPEALFDVIVSNPPYITEAEKQQMHPNVLGYEPHLALFVGNGNPLQFYEAIAKFASSHLQPQGKLYFEVNPQYAEDVKLCMQRYGLSDVNILNDMQGKPRMIKGINDR